MRTQLPPKYRNQIQTKYSLLEVDFISILGSAGYSEDATGKIKDFLHEYEDFVKPYALMAIGGVYTLVHVRNSIAASIADWLWDFALIDMKAQFGDIYDTEVLKDKIFNSGRWSE